MPSCCVEDNVACQYKCCIAVLINECIHVLSRILYFSVILFLTNYIQWINLNLTQWLRSDFVIWLWLGCSENEPCKVGHANLILLIASLLRLLSAASQDIFSASWISGCCFYCDIILRLHCWNRLLPLLLKTLLRCVNPTYAPRRCPWVLSSRWWAVCRPQLPTAQVKVSLTHTKALGFATTSIDRLSR